MTIPPHPNDAAQAHHAAQRRAELAAMTPVDRHWDAIWQIRNKSRLTDADYAQIDSHMAKINEMMRETT